jgi:hypothetical protein
MLMVSEVQGTYFKLNATPSPPYTVCNQPNALFEVAPYLQRSLKIRAKAQAANKQLISPREKTSDGSKAGLFMNEDLSYSMENEDVPCLESQDMQLYSAPVESPDVSYSPPQSPKERRNKNTKESGRERRSNSKSRKDKSEEKDSVSRGKDKAEEKDSVSRGKDKLEEKYRVSRGKHDSEISVKKTRRPIPTGEAPKVAESDRESHAQKIGRLDLPEKKRSKDASRSPRMPSPRTPIKKQQSEPGALRPTKAVEDNLPKTKHGSASSGSSRRKAPIDFDDVRHHKTVPIRA